MQWRAKATSAKIVAAVQAEAGVAAGVAARVQAGHQVEVPLAEAGVALGRHRMQESDISPAALRDHLLLQDPGRRHLSDPFVRAHDLNPRIAHAAVVSLQTV